MNEKKPKTTRGIVAMLDALGIRNASNEEIDKFISFMPTMEEFTKMINMVYAGSHLSLEGLGKEENFSIFRFGDTILLVWKNASQHDEMIGLVPIAQVLSKVIILGLSKGIRLRGAVSIGEMILDDRTVLGPVINDVASWYDKTEFIGVVATPQCGQLLSYRKLNPVTEDSTDEKMFKREFDASFQKYDVPIKGNSTQKLWVVNWPNKITSKNQDRLGWYFDRTRKLSIPFGTEQKYENTERFVVEMLKRGEA